MTGYGAGTFESLYSLSNGAFSGIQHSHNIFLEIAINHGLPSSLIIFIFFVFITINSWRKLSYSTLNQSLLLNKRIKNLDKAWIISFITFFIIHIFDITYFDGRISTLAWILLSGMRVIIRENSLAESSK